MRLVNEASARNNGLETSALHWLETAQLKIVKIVFMNFIWCIIMSAIASTDIKAVADFTCVVSTNAIIDVIVVLLSMVLLLPMPILEFVTDATTDANEWIYFSPR